MSTEDPKPVCTCPRIDAAQFGLYGEGHHYVPGRPDPNCHFHGGSTPVSEEPARRVSFPDLPAQYTAEDMANAQHDAYEAGRSEGRRQAAEAIRSADTSGWQGGRQSEVDDCQERAAQLAEGGPWEPAEQPAVVVHRCPPSDSGSMPCCGRTPFEVPGDQMTDTPSLVTCKPAEGGSDA